MGSAISQTTARRYGLTRVCAVFDIARSSLYKKPACDAPRKRGPRPCISDESLIQEILDDIADSPFTGEGYRKVHARIRRRGVPVSKHRVLGAMRDLQLLSPHRVRQPESREHDGTIVTEEPNVMWCSDGTKIRTVRDGWVWIFSVEEHWNAECLGWHVCKVGNTMAALEAVTASVRNIYGSLGAQVARGLRLRIDNGCQYTSELFRGQLKYLGIEPSFGMIRQPETNGVAERFNRTLKDQILRGSLYNDVEEVREAMRQFVQSYNEKWLLGKLSYRSPLEARREYEKRKGVA